MSAERVSGRRANDSIELAVAFDAPAELVRSSGPLANLLHWQDLSLVREVGTGSCLSAAWARVPRRGLFQPAAKGSSESVVRHARTGIRICAHEQQRAWVLAGHEGVTLAADAASALSE